METQFVIVGLVSIILGIGLGAGILHFYGVIQGNKKKESAEKEAERIVNKAKSQVAKIERDANTRAKDFESRARKNAEAEIKKQKQKFQQQESQLKEKEQQLQKEYKKKEDEVEVKSKEIKEKMDRMNIAEDRIKKMEEETQLQVQNLQKKLEAISTLTVEQAKVELKLAIEDEAHKLAAEKIEQIEIEAKKEADQKAKQILTTAISRYASEVATERTVSIIGLTSDEMKGKIIGREGRNIRALEAACGVDLIVDETPESVVISSFDPVRREIARQTLQKLMEDGRVHPGRIEEVVSHVRSQIQQTIKEDGEKACFELDISNMHTAIQNLIGSLKYRQSNMQNLYKQSLDVAYLAGMLAGEINANVKVARRAGLLHMIGRAIDHTVEGSYASIGAEFCRRHGEEDFICQAVRCHNGEVEARSVLDHLVQAAYNLSEARPGAKRNSMEGYIKRLEDLESIGNSFDGVSRTFAIQAGKEIRVLVDSGKITDEQSKMLVRDIARKIERELNYPGQVKVTVVRETRIVEHAR
jgi:ribonuclease Y